MKDCTAGVRSDRRVRDLGIVNSLIAKIAAKAVRADNMHLFNVLGRNWRLFLAWLPFSGVLLGLGKLPRQDTELIILRVGHLRGCTYELQHHSRIAKRYGIDEVLQARIAEGPHSRRRVTREDNLMKCVDDIVMKHKLSVENRKWLAYYYSPAQIVEFCTVVTQYDALATMISVLEIPLDFPEN